MKHQKLKMIRLLVAVALGGTISAAIAAPTVSRLTPPSERFATGVNDPAAPMIARFFARPKI